MRTSEFDYDLPSKNIAQRPAEPRDSSRLLILHRENGTMEHRRFTHILDYLNRDDLLVLNETLVFPAKLVAKKIPTGGAAELLLLQREDSRTWQAIVGGRGIGVGRRLSLKDGITAEIIQDLGEARRLVRFDAPLSEKLEQIGEIPLPPYIHQPLQSIDEYQTVFARYSGSSAAPTAGLHFTQDLLDQIRFKGIQIAKITLHIGLDTFAPIKSENALDHPIHQEWCKLSAETAEQINRTSKTGGRVFGVGTTTVRTLETASQHAATGDRVGAFEGFTDLFIYPGYPIRSVDSILTNFHLPRSSLLLMISAFTGRETLLATYRKAITHDYRFYSFGDAMLIL